MGARRWGEYTDPSGERQPRDDVLEEALAGGPSRFRELADDLRGRGYELGRARRLHGAAGDLAIALKALSRGCVLTRDAAPGGGCLPPRGCSSAERPPRALGRFRARLAGLGLRRGRSVGTGAGGAPVGRLGRADRPLTAAWRCSACTGGATGAVARGHSAPTGALRARAG